MAGVTRIRVGRARQRQSPGWLRLLVITILAAVGAGVLWNGLQYSTAHGGALGNVRRAARQAANAAAGGKAAEQPVDGAGGKKAATHANLEAWMQLTDLGGGSDDAAGKDTSSSAAGSSSEGSSQAGSGSSTAADLQAGKAGDTNGFITVLLKVPKMPPTYNSWVLAEDMLLFHLRALQQQLEQTYVGMALAAATGRGFILPEFQCFCQNSEAPLPRCRRPDAASLQFPVPCQTDEVLVAPEEFARDPASRGAVLDVRPPSFLEQLEKAAGGSDQSAELVLRPSAQLLYQQCQAAPPNPGGQPDAACTRQSSREGETGVTLVPPSLNDTELLPLVKHLGKFKLWRLDFSDLGSHWHAFGGWDCAEPARRFDQRMRTVVKPWPAPEAAAAAAAGGDPASVPPFALNMTAGRVYSAHPDMREKCEDGAAAAGR